MSLDSLAMLCMDMGDHGRRYPVASGAGAVPPALGEKHPRYALSLNNLAVLYRKWANGRRRSNNRVRALEHALREKKAGLLAPGHARVLRACRAAWNACLRD